MRRSSVVRRSIVTLILVPVFLLGLVTGVVLAANYMGTGQFPVRQLRWAYTGLVTGYEPLAELGMGKWHTWTDLDLIKVTQSWDIIYATWDYGNVSWNGYAFICDGQGNCDNQTAWNNQYASCEARVNRYRLDGYADIYRENVFMHEAGHCFSLGHRWSGIMWPYTRAYNNLNGTDKSLINARY